MEYQVQGLDSVVGLEFDDSLTYSLMNEVTVKIKELEAGLFSYRFIVASNPKTKICSGLMIYGLQPTVLRINRMKTLRQINVK